MEITDNDLRDNYSSMETDDLLALLAQGTLTDQAKSILEEILIKRDVSVDYIHETTETIEKDIRREEAFYKMLAARWVRLYAKLIDVAIAMIPFAVASSLGAERLITLALLFSVFYISFGDGFNGQSIGKRIAKIMVVRQGTMKPCTPGLSALRNSLLFILGKIDMLFIFRESRKRLGDSLAGTLVIKKE